MRPIQTVGVIGLGSLGVLYATLFTDALGKDRVLVLADSRRTARYREEGVWCNDQLRMRCGFHFDYKGMELTYHKTLPYSTIVETDPKDGVTYDILYDILIKQNGDIHSDWDGTLLDVDAYEKVVFEPYDLKWLARIA